MGSLIPGYEYDIFISYRQNDNKYDGWVTEFVANLNKELEATIKDKVTVYFDANPHDGLLETHLVDKSLEEKLRCLIFIPILSRTYCDPKSYAWVNEFMAFLKIARGDKIGLNVKLLSGNVASRILPVRIHDLNSEDIELAESQIGVIRGIDFIYKEPGVNRSLTPKDSDEKNTNKTSYRNQINKVANAIDEIIHVIRRIHIAPGGRDTESDYPEATMKESGKIDNQKQESASKRKIKGWLISVLLLALCVGGVFWILKVIEKSKQADDIAKLEKSIAVLPFRNDSPSDSTTYFINGVMEDILNDLQKIKALRVISRTSVEKYRNTNKSISEIAGELGVNYIVVGSGQKSGKAFRLSSQLLSAKKESYLWGKIYEQEIHDPKNLFKIQSQIAESIALELEAVITPQEKQLIEKSPTSSLAAYQNYFLGMDYLGRFSKEDFDIALRYFEKAKEIDSEYALAYAGIASVWINRAINSYATHGEAAPIAKANLAKAFELDSSRSEIFYSLGLNQIFIDYNFKGAETSLKKCISLNPNNSYGLAAYGTLLVILGQPGEALVQHEMALKLDPMNMVVKANYGFTLYCAGRYNEAIKVLQEVIIIDPGNVIALDNLPLVLHEVGRYSEELEAWKVDYSIAFKDYANVFDRGYINGGLTGALNLQADSLVKKSKTKYIQPCEIAQIYACAGNKEKTLEMLEHAYDVRDAGLPLMLRLPVYEFIHNEPRYHVLFDKINLPFKP